ncbi:hypothetical protein ACWGQ4_34720 [Streptomyces sp. NPDC055721]
MGTILAHGTDNALDATAGPAVRLRAGARAHRGRERRRRGVHALLAFFKV